MVANRVRPDEVDAVAAEVTADVPVYVVPEDTLLMAPTMAEVLAACDGDLVGGSPEALGREALGVLVGGDDGAQPARAVRPTARLLITPGDRADVVLTACSPTRRARSPRPPASC